ncbi:hypothetical protein ACFUJY_22370 [Streptomyces sp. NPDC057249]|uniref:hypothetical protein n=1 Tax=Streptomyces sp. NPDC057249 TaxID=3346067 RepID=UPI00363C1E75
MAGHPAINIGLPAGSQGQILYLEPVQEIDGRPQVLPRGRELVVGDLLALVASAKPT